MAEEHDREPTPEEQEQEAREREERIARRVERRNHGRHHVRAGLTRGVPWQLEAPDAHAQEVALDHEISMIESAVREEGPIADDELRRLVGARFWGPGRFRPAVKEAIADGRVVRAGHSRLAPPHGS